MDDGVSSQSLRDFNRALREYLQYNKREAGPLIENRAKKVQWELYRQFKAIATTPEKIEQEAKARNYQIRRRLRKGGDGKHLSVKEELVMRKKSIAYLSVSFLHRAWRANRDGQNTNFAAKSRSNRKIGEAIIRTTKGQRSPQVRLSSFLEGVLVQNRQRALVEKTLRAQVADMGVYVRKKQQEALKQTIAKTFS